MGGNGGRGGYLEIIPPPAALKCVDAKQLQKKNNNPEELYHLKDTDGYAAERIFLGSLQTETHFYGIVHGHIILYSVNTFLAVSWEQAQQQCLLEL